MLVYSLGKIAHVTGGKLFGDPNIQIDHLITDSRLASVTHGSLFIAVTGKNHNGHLFIDDLYNRGVRSFLVSDYSDGLKKHPDAGFVVVNNTLDALQQLAAWHRRQFNAKIIAITGSNGKTIVKEWLYHCLCNKYSIVRSPKSYNSQLGVPLSLMLLDESSELGIFEAGISLSAEMEKLEEMILPDTGIFTNIGEAHQENFTSMEEKVAEKLKLFVHCKNLIYCADHEFIDAGIRRKLPLNNVRLFTWSRTGKSDIKVSPVRATAIASMVTIEYAGQSFEVKIPFTDHASVENALHCIALMLLYSIDHSLIIQRIGSLPPVAMRLEQISGINNCTVINDSYNSDLISLSIALDVLGQQFQHRKKTLILSDIYQTGKQEQELYQNVAGLLRAKGISRLIGIGETIGRFSGIFEIKGDYYPSTEAFIVDFRNDNFRDEAILLKGSRSFEFERIAALLELKKHTTRIEINLNALAHNLNFFRSQLKPGVKTMVMVKALSYGSGRHEIAGVLQFQRTDYLGVAIADEGVSLRKAGITIPIMVMNPEADSFETIIRYKLEPEIYSFAILDAFHKALIRNQEMNYPVHLKIDTGMHRLGFLKQEIPVLCDMLHQYKSLRICSVFSHLAGSDEEVFDDFTQEQIAVFKESSAMITQSLGYPVIRHILNTSGIERFPDAQFDMVRLGIGLYGVSSIAQSKLRNVSTLKSTILQIKPVMPGDTVGYSRKGKPGQPSTIAIVPVGYADGLNRGLGNGNGFFMVNNKPAPIIGNICMDMTMINVTGIEIHEGDEVEIFGEGVPIADVARRLNTIPYEVLTGVSERVKRVYIYE